MDLDIQEGSDEFDSVSKGRRLQKQVSNMYTGYKNRFVIYTGYKKRSVKAAS